MQEIDPNLQSLYGGKIRIRVCGICIIDNKILLANHSGLGLEKDFWNPPGGGLEFGEDIKTCLKREFIEETGLHIQVEELLFVNQFINLPLHAVELFFRVKTNDSTLSLGYDPEHDIQILKEIKWFSESDLKQISANHIHSIFQGFTDFTTFLQKTGNFTSFQP
jgi:8-oxo-dGTP diphosphatase